MITRQHAVDGSHYAREWLAAAVNPTVFSTPDRLEAPNVA